MSDEGTLIHHAADNLRAAALDELRTGARQFYDQLTEDQKPIVEAALTDLTRLTARLVGNPHMAEQIGQELQFVKSTLTSEAALAAIRAEEELRAAIGRVLMRVLSGVVTFAAAAV